MTSFKYIFNKTKKTYACKKAITNSKKVTQKITNNGKKANPDHIKEIEQAETPIDQAKPTKILSKICPDNILAKRRTDKLTTLAIYETSSITNNTGIINKGTPDGKNKPNQRSP